MDGSGSQTSEYAVGYDWKVAYGIVSLFSMLSSLTIPIIYKISKRTRHHPAELLVLICICEIVCCYHLLIYCSDVFNFLEFFKVFQMADAWTFGDLGNDQADELQYYQTGCNVNLFVYFGALFLQFSFYQLLCVDLIITLTKPFIPGNRRMLFYIPLSICQALILLVWTSDVIENYCEKQISQLPNQYYPMLFISIPPVLLQEAIFYFLGIVSIFMAIRNKQKTKLLAIPEMVQAKDKYIYNHTLFIAVIFFIWLFPFAYNLYELKSPDYYNFIQDLSISSLSSELILINNISVIILLSQGIFIGFVRLSEDYFRLRLLALLQRIICCKENQKFIEEEEGKDEKETDVWNLSLAALIGKLHNSELVRSLLMGLLSIIKYEDASSNIPNELIWLPSEAVLKRWARDMKRKKFSLDVTSELVEVQSSLTKTPRSSHKEGLPKEEKLIKDHEKFLVRVTEYAPRIFKLLRRMANLSEEQLQKSLDVILNDRAILNAQQSMGKSGAFFFFSYDKRIIIKTINTRELEVMKDRILIPYCKHIKENSKSLLSRCYGTFTIEIDGVSPVHIIMMENSFTNLSQYQGPVRSYDLKGSIKNRFVNTSRTINVKNSGSTSISSLNSIDHSVLNNGNMMRVGNCSRVLKDLNFIHSEDMFIQLDPKLREALFEQIKQDSEFLCNNRIMDYSLLVGFAEVENLDRDAFKGQNFRAMPEAASNKIISISIIDYLQLFDTMKLLEYQYKTLLKRNQSKHISCVSPNQYQVRFCNFMNSIIVALFCY